MADLDHLILLVNDREASIAFYTRVLGFTHEGREGPFSILRVSTTCTLQFVERSTQGGEHLAFAMTREEFDATFARIKSESIPYGDTFMTVGSGRGPGDEVGARGKGDTIYFFDPNKHLLEIRCYS